MPKKTSHGSQCSREILYFFSCIVMIYLSRYLYLPLRPFCVWTVLFTAACWLLRTAQATGCYFCTGLHPAHGCAHLGGSKLTARGRNTPRPKLLIQILYFVFLSLLSAPLSPPLAVQGASPPPTPQHRLARRSTPRQSAAADAGKALPHALH